MSIGLQFGSLLPVSYDTMAHDNSSVKSTGMEQSAATSPTDTRGPAPRFEPTTREQDADSDTESTVQRNHPPAISTSVRMYSDLSISLI